MCDGNEAWDSKGLWSPYSPDARTSWDLRRVAHLHRRAGFGATWTELQRDLKDGPGASIDRLLTGRTRAESVPEDFESVSAALAARGTPDGTQAFLDPRLADPSRLRAWWVHRMYNGPDPLGERLALMWHNHFATSDLKVRDLAAMGRQNETFRRLARAPFADLLRAMARDPALLVWLDAPANRRGRPNENFAREFLELFTLGIGNYSESDVKEAARALTGWAAGDDPMREAPELHDPGEKTILGKTGKWNGGDLIRIVLDHPALARRLAWRICEFLLGEDAADAAALGALATGLRAHKLDIGWAVGTVLRSRRFFADGNIGTRVQGPAEFEGQGLRGLASYRPPRAIGPLREGAPWSCSNATNGATTIHQSGLLRSQTPR